MTAPGTPLERLIAAWIDWEANPGWSSTTNRKEDLLHELDLPGSAFHDAVADMRQRGYSISDAVQTATNSIAPHLALNEWKEAS